MDPSVLDFITKQNALSKQVGSLSLDIFKQSMEMYTVINSLPDTLKEKEILKKTIQNQMVSVSQQKNIEVEFFENLEKAMSEWKDNGLVKWCVLKNSTKVLFLLIIYLTVHAKRFRSVCFCLSKN